MFICEKCKTEKFENFAFYSSMGACEFCGEVAPCCDIKCSALIDKKPKEEKDE
jgi:hypothetical protein